MRTASPRFPLRRRPALRSQSGYSLVELSVAMLIALFLIAGVLIVEQGVHRTYQDNSGLSKLEDNERFAMSVIAGAIQSAGYYPDPTTNTLTTALPAETTTPPQGPQSDQLAFQSGQSVYGLYQSATPNDSIAVRFMAGTGSQIDLCDGTPAQAGDRYTTYLYLNTGSHILYCELETNGTWSPTPVPLLTGITNMQVFYGVNSSGSDNNVQSYLFAPDVSNWSGVTAVRVTLTLTNPLQGEPGQTATASFSSVVTLMNRVGVDL